MSKKRMTKKLKERKALVCEKLIFKKEKHYLWLISLTAFYRCSSLHVDILAKRVSRLHLEIFESKGDFFSCFLKHEPVKELTCSIKNELPKTKDIYIGSSTEKFLSASSWKETWDREKVSGLREKSFHWLSYIHATKVSIIQQTAHLNCWTWFRGCRALLCVCSLLKEIIKILSNNSDRTGVERKLLPWNI